ENFRRGGAEERITLLEGDAAEILGKLAGEYDLIFMDAAKGQYIHFLPDVLRLLAPGGLLVSDNVLQDGDIIEYSIPDRTLNACLTEDEIARRRAEWKPTYNKVSSSWLSRYRKLATNASRGAVLQSGE
ncbi:dihydroxy-acid dehydratase, partial [uncultured Akkermansia sp.]|uniref:O-methyltransferase n=1 Tax=uncultured Akkermansia sp. TaxID=512294 RepID=UPI002670101F